MIVYTSNPSNQKSEAEGWLLQVHPGLHSNMLSQEANTAEHGGMERKSHPAQKTKAGNECNANQIYIEFQAGQAFLVISIYI